MKLLFIKQNKIKILYGKNLVIHKIHIITQHPLIGNKISFPYVRTYQALEFLLHLAFIILCPYCKWLYLVQSLFLKHLLRC